MAASYTERPLTRRTSEPAVDRAAWAAWAHAVRAAGRLETQAAELDAFAAWARNRDREAQATLAKACAGRLWAEARAAWARAQAVEPAAWAAGSREKVWAEKADQGTIGIDKHMQRRDDT